MTYTRESIFRSVKQFSLIGLVPFLAQIVSFNYSAVMPLLQRDWGMTATQAGAVFSAQQIGFVLAAVVLTVLTDFVPAGWIFIFSSLGVGLANIGFALFAAGFPTAFLLRGTVGFCLGGTYMPGLRAISETKPANQRGKVVGLFVGALVLGGAASQSLTGLLLSWLDWRSAFTVSSLGVFGGTYLAYRLMKRVPPPARTARRYDVGILKRVLGSRPLMVVIVVYAMHMWELYGVRGWLATYLAETYRRQGVGQVHAVSKASNWAALIVAVGGVLVWFGGRISDRLGRTGTVLIFMIGGSFFSFVFGWLMPLPMPVIIAAGVIYGFLVIGDSAVISTTIIDLAPTEVRGTAMALQTLFGFSVAAASPLVFGIVLDGLSAVDSPHSQTAWGTAFGILGAVSLLGALLVLWLRRLKKM